MGFLKKFFGWVDDGPPQTKSVSILDVPVRSAGAIRSDLASGFGGSVHALQVSTVFACARVIAEGLSQIPCQLQRTSASGGRELAVDHPLYDLLSRAPNDYQTSFEFREMLAFHLVLESNAFVFVSRDTKGRPIELLPLLPSQVSVERINLGEVRYRVGLGTTSALYDKTTVWHLKGPSWDGVCGLPAVVAARNAIQLAADTEAFGTQLFRNGSRPSGILTTEQTLGAEQYAALVHSWQAQNAGLANAHKTAVLHGGLTWQQMQTSANDAQFIEARRYQVEEICRVMRVNPIMVMQSVGTAAYASVEQMFLAHLTHTLAPWHARFEQSAENALLSAAERKAGYRVHLDSRQMLRGSAVDRMAYLKTAIEAGIMTQNEGRDAEGLDRINDPDADRLRPAANVFGTAPQQNSPDASAS
jgi:HK97 family phage portal protein